MRSRISAIRVTILRTPVEAATRSGYPTGLSDFLRRSEMVMSTKNREYAALGAARIAVRIGVANLDVNVFECVADRVAKLAKDGVVDPAFQMQQHDLISRVNESRQSIDIEVPPIKTRREIGH
jgi:hypothetical protein